MPTPKEEVLVTLYRRLEDPELSNEEFDATLARIERLEGSVSTA